MSGTRTVEQPHPTAGQGRITPSGETGSVIRPNRVLVALRLAVNGLARIDARAERRRVDRSEMMRRMLAYADQHMPEEWTP